jgi:hypothetical protein
MLENYLGAYAFAAARQVYPQNPPSWRVAVASVSGQQETFCPFRR